MEDIIVWLRSSAQEYGNGRCDEAADRIEALEAALLQIRGLNDNPAHYNVNIDAVIDAAQEKTND